MVVLGGSGIWTMIQINTGVVTITNQDLPKVFALANTRANLLKLGRDLGATLLRSW